MALSKKDFLISYDDEGNLLLKIPNHLVKNFEENLIIKAIENLAKTKRAKKEIRWEGDSLLNIIGICQSGLSDGSINHDKYIYNS